MDNMFMDSFFFAVPIRLIWNNWQRFNGEQDNPEDSTDFLVPTMSAPASTGYAELSLSDYLGIPTKIAELEHMSLFHRAYNLIWNEWFRDQNMQDSVVVDKGDGPDDPADYVLLRRGKRHDYFTSCLPWPQKGPAVDLPIGSTAPVITDGTVPTWIRPTQTEFALSVAGGTGNISASVIPGSGFSDWTFLNSGLEADLSAAAGSTVNALRQAFQIQKLYERDARGGTRYTEIIRSHFGVVSPDARLQRPEYLGGGSTPIQINPIAQTSETDGTPQGNLAAIGAVTLNNHGFTKSFTEHSIILGMVMVRADLTYQQGLPRMFSRSTRWDFYWPALSHIGEQAVLNKEIFAQNDANDDLVFGYQERFAEYRYKPSQITGRFRSNATASLDTWHLAQEFSGLPALGPEFIEEDPPIDRVIAVLTEPQFLFDAYFKMTCARPMPVYSVPGLIDHF
jgi:hypothetical protein